MAAPERGRFLVLYVVQVGPYRRVRLNARLGGTKTEAADETTLGVESKRRKGVRMMHRSVIESPHRRVATFPVGS